MPTDLSRLVPVRAFGSSRHEKHSQAHTRNAIEQAELFRNLFERSG